MISGMNVRVSVLEDSHIGTAQTLSARCRDFLSWISVSSAALVFHVRERSVATGVGLVLESRNRLVG